MKKIYTTIIILFFTIKSFSQYFDQSFILSLTNSYSIQNMSFGFFSVDKYGNRYAHTLIGTQGYPPNGHFKCIKSNGSGWSLIMNSSYGAAMTEAQPDNFGNTICAGYTNSLFHFNAAQTVSYQGGNFYVKFDSLGNPLWAVPRYGSSPAADKAGGFISVGGGTIYKYNSDGNITWQKPGGGGYTATSFDNEYFYLLGTSLSKCDTAGNIIWTTGSYAGSNKLVTDSMENIYIRSGSNIHKLDSAGNFIFTRTYPGMVDYTIDKGGNIFILLERYVKKYDVSGFSLLWSYYSTAEVENKKMGVDRNNRIHYVAYYSDYTDNFQPNEIFLPPAFHHSPAGIYSYLSFLCARISQDPASALNTILTGNMPLNTVQNACSGSTFDCPFTINSFPVNPPFNPMFKVQLSDSSGSFANASIIGQGNYSPISCTIPGSVVPGNNYRTRVMVSDFSLTGTPNANGSFKIQTSPPSAFTVSNYGKFKNGAFYGCAGGAPVQLTAVTLPNCKYQWYGYDFYDESYIYIPGAIDTTYNVTSSNNKTYYVLFTTDTIFGCTGISGIKTIVFSAPVAPYISNLPASVCLDHAPVNLNGQPSGGVFSGSGMTGKFFHPDSAGTGVHNITYTYDSWGCGIVDTVQSITVKGLPSAGITASDPTTFCSGGSVVLNAPVYNNRAYQWKKGGTDIPGATSSNYTASIGGVYKAAVTNTVSGCSKTTVPGKVVTVNPLPDATITPQGPTTFCAGGSVILSANTGTGLTYRWKKDGTTIPGATSVNYVATTGGVYKVKELNSYGCSKLSTGVVVSVPCREEEELNDISGGISIFPNPASGKFTIRSLTGKISQIIITNVSGQIIYKNEFPGSPSELVPNYREVRGVEIDLTNQPKGIYLIQVITGKEVYNEKIILN
ncbi:MAG TPA: T9SS type A sorting domain-containing protein [Bacteroidia bacterium]|nr:T9SS type A sorting domain-containing protein [Bacteroidia bacterium]